MKKICRICRHSDISELMSIYCITTTHHKHIVEILETVAGVNSSDNDRLPDQICNKCFKELDDAYSLWKRCQNLSSKCPEGQTNRYFRCRICMHQDVTELISLQSLSGSWKMKVHEMVRFFSDVSVEQGSELPPFVCDACLDDLDRGMKLKRLCLESDVDLRRERTYAWEKMEFQANKHERLVVDLFAELLPSGDSGKLHCSVCEVEALSSEQLRCKGCLLQFENKIETNGCDDHDEMQGEESNEFFDILEDNPTGLYQKIRCKGPVCCGCKEIFSSKDGLRRHRKTAHPPVRIDVRDEYYCKFCSHNLDSAAELSEHHRMIGEKHFLFCKICQKVQTNSNRHQLAFHIPEEIRGKFTNEVITTYECCVTGCNSFYDTQDQLLKHFTAVHVENESADDNSCGYCRAYFPTVEPFRRMHESHTIVQEKFRCQIDDCSYAVYNIDRIISHCSQEPHKVVSARRAKKAKSKHDAPDLKHFTAIGDEDDVIDVLERKSKFCCGCFEFFETTQEFTAHCEEKHATSTGDFCCRTCKREFTNESALRTHENKAAGEIYYYCRPCKAFLWDIQQMNRHKAYAHADIAWSDVDERYERVSEEAHICCGCDKQLTSEEELFEHRRVKHIRTSKFGRKCHLCQKMFDSPEQLQRHMDVSDSGVVFKCKVADCIFRCKQLSTIKLHVSSKSHHNADGPIFLRNADLTQHRCCFFRCDFSSASYDDIITHAATDHSMKREENRLHPHPHHTITCPVCYKGMRNKTALVLHQNGRSKVICKCCLKTVKREEYSSHLDACRSQSKVICEKCSEELPSRAHLKMHNRKKHGIQLKSATKTVCNICGKSYNSVEMREHMRAHKNKRIWKCDLCPRRFNSHAIFKVHSRVHTNEKNYQCRRGCEKKFKYTGDRVRHEKTIHLGIKPFSCTVCSAAFVRDRELRLHMRKHTGMKLFACDKCGASFNKMDEFRQHKEGCTVLLTSLESF